MESMSPLAFAESVNENAIFTEEALAASWCQKKNGLSAHHSVHLAPPQRQSCKRAGRLEVSGLQRLPFMRVRRRGPPLTLG